MARSNPAPSSKGGAAPDQPAERSQTVALLAAARRGDASAIDALMQRMHPELKRIAVRRLGAERAGHTLQPTALVNEAYIRTFGGETVDWRDRAHFLALMALQIRRILIDHGRARRAEKRGAGAVRLSLDELNEQGVGMSEDYFALDEALTALHQEEPRAARVVEMKFFGGMTDEEVAEVLDISMPTVNRDWRYARAWLHARLGEA